MTQEEERPLTEAEIFEMARQKAVRRLKAQGKESFTERELITEAQKVFKEFQQRLGVKFT